MSTAQAGVLAAAALLGLLVVWGSIRMIVPTLRAAEKAQATNFRGRAVFYGLGIVWLIWAGCAIIMGVVAAAFARDTVLPLLTLAGPLALVAFALGLIDDAYGSSADRGFKGHLRAMLKGRLTTGGMKLVGIGLASLVVALIMSQVAPWAGPGIPASPLTLRGAGSVLLAGASIALTSNLFNLLDLRPGRALKAYGLLLPLAVVSVTVGLGMSAGGPLRQSSGVIHIAVESIALFLMLLGPLLAVWRYDLGEEGMLGDSGANPMGFVIGLMIVSGLPLWGLSAWTALVFGLNLASERVSFSAVIEGNALLRTMDGWGRLELDELHADPSVDVGTPQLEESTEIKSGN